MENSVPMLSIMCSHMKIFKVRFAKPGPMKMFVGVLGLCLGSVVLLVVMNPARRVCMETGRVKGIHTVLLVLVLNLASSHGLAGGRRVCVETGSVKGLQTALSVLMLDLASSHRVARGSRGGGSGGMLMGMLAPSRSLLRKVLWL